MAVRNLFPFGIDEEGPTSPPGLGVPPVPTPAPPAVPVPGPQGPPRPGQRPPTPGASLPGLGDGTSGTSKRFRQEEDKFNENQAAFDPEKAQKDGEINWMAVLAPALGAAAGAAVGGRKGALLGATAGAGYLKGQVQQQQMKKLREDKKTATLMKNLDSLKGPLPDIYVNLMAKLVKETTGKEISKEDLHKSLEDDKRFAAAELAIKKINVREDNKKFDEAYQMRLDTFPVIHGREPTPEDLERMKRDYEAALNREKLSNAVKVAQREAFESTTKKNLLAMEIAKAKQEAAGTGTPFDLAKSNKVLFQVAINNLKLDKNKKVLVPADVKLTWDEIEDNPELALRFMDMQQQAGGELTVQHVYDAYVVAKNSQPDLVSDRNGKLIPFEDITGLEDPTAVPADIGGVTETLTPEQEQAVKKAIDTAGKQKVMLTKEQAIKILDRDKPGWRTGGVGVNAAGIQKNIHRGYRPVQQKTP